VKKQTQTFTLAIAVICLLAVCGYVGVAFAGHQEQNHDENEPT